MVSPCPRACVGTTEPTQTPARGDCLGLRTPETGPMNDTCLAFHPLSFVPENDEVIVGRPDIDAYIVLPADGAAALVRMTQGMSPSDAAAWYESEYGQALDIDAFLATLRDLLFVREEDEAASALAARRVRF